MTYLWPVNKRLGREEGVVTRCNDKKLLLTIDWQQTSQRVMQWRRRRHTRLSVLPVHVDIDRLQHSDDKNRMKIRGWDIYTRDLSVIEETYLENNSLLRTSTLFTMACLLRGLGIGSHTSSLSELIMVVGLLSSWICEIHANVIDILTNQLLLCNLNKWRQRSTWQPRMRRVAMCHSINSEID